VSGTLATEPTKARSRHLVPFHRSVLPAYLGRVAVIVVVVALAILLGTLSSR
jgi:hypothetical protein